MSLSIKKIAFIGNYVPRRCGIATFTADLCSAIKEQFPEIQCLVIAVSDMPGQYKYPEEVRFEIDEKDISSYQRAAEFININDVDVVCLQHEFGIFGGSAGSHILALLREIKAPVITTLHTILDKPSTEQRKVMEGLSQICSCVVSMTRKGEKLLKEVYNIPQEKIDVIPHGIPNIPFVDPNFYKDVFGVEGKLVLLTFGLISPNKGIEHVLNALPEVISEYPQTMYIVLGATHPNLVRQQGEMYRMNLERLAVKNGVQKNVIFYNRYVELDQLKEFIGAADIYITPYLNEAQITSGTLSYCFGAGKAVISTPYWHAAELLSDGKGTLVPFGDSKAIAREVINLFRDEVKRHAMRKTAYLLGRDMVWSNVASVYVKTFETARITRGRMSRRLFSAKTLDQQKINLPEFRFDQLIMMTDSTGVLQHAKYTIPDYHEGYCTDDNARALILSVLLEELEIKVPEIERMAVRCIAFVNHAFNPEAGRFRNFLTFSRQWLEDAGSEDSQGRAIWSLGTCVGRTKNEGIQRLAGQLLEKALPAVSTFTSPRAWAFALIGIHEYFRRLNGDRLFNTLRHELTDRLTEIFRKNSSSEWPWCEDIVTYTNAKIPHALILSGRWTDRQDALQIGLKALRWLVEIQTSPEGYFRAVGSNGFYQRNQEKAKFDQQPVEAYSMVSACIEAYRTTGDEYWFNAAKMAFEWFLGRNDLGAMVYNPETGGCRDALHVDRVNMNEGGESTLAFLLSLAEMKLLMQSL
ncbi:MAG TPA: glycosyltransferase family 4 protein [Chitinispirillaceae bacterium]|jgi:glycosyltransferase involved in cell wall biosynthesis|nr:glycosyltransferase family 4 protein [Chitinispirillaceae bacterium]